MRHVGIEENSLARQQAHEIQKVDTETSDVTRELTMQQQNN